MVNETICLNDLYPAIPKGEKPALLETVCRSHYDEYGVKKYPGMIICPGGGYGFVSEREAEAIALHFAAKGIQCFIVRYNIAPTRYPTQLFELAAAFDYVRKNAQRYHVMPDFIAVMGFSAGGHLAANYSTTPDLSHIASELGSSCELLKPDAMALCYGVLSSGEYTHETSMKNLLGEKDTIQIREKVSPEKNVTPNTPPAFLWHTASDQVVPVQNSLIMAKALADNAVPFEMHIYPKGNHGLATVDWVTVNTKYDDVPYSKISKWIENCAEWLLTMAGKDLLK